MYILLQIAYHGIPGKAYEVFMEAHRTNALKSSIKVSNVEANNPAGLKLGGGGGLRCYSIIRWA